MSATLLLAQHALGGLQHAVDGAAHVAARIPELGSPTATRTSDGEQFAFWTLGPLAVIGALGMILVRNAVHAALMLVMTMFVLAVFYVLNQAPFLGAVEIIVYAGAIMILFLFVLMLVGVDSSDSLIETIKGQRVAAVVAGVGFVALMTGAIGWAVAGRATTGLNAANNADNGNVPGIARLLFTTYVFPFEAVSALLIIAAIGAMVLGHRERAEPRSTQAQLMRERFGDYRDSGSHPGSLPGPGVFAIRDDSAARAVLPSGEPDEESVPSEYALDRAGAHAGYASPAHDKPRGELSEP